MQQPRSPDTWFQTFTGKAWWPFDPKPEDVDLADIAHGLAYQCRFNGHTRKFYSVAEHSVRMADELMAAGDRAALAGLLHDAAEAYLGDIVRPIKRQLPLFHTIERTNLEAIFEGLGVPILAGDYRDDVAKTDLILLATERRDLMAKPPRPWAAIEGIEPLADTIVPVEPGEIEAWFLSTFHVLMGRLSRDA